MLGGKEQRSVALVRPHRNVPVLGRVPRTGVGGDASGGGGISRPDLPMRTMIRPKLVAPGSVCKVVSSKLVIVNPLA